MTVGFEPINTRLFNDCQSHFLSVKQNRTLVQQHQHVQEPIRLVSDYYQPLLRDVTTFSPQGRLHQVEYAMESQKLGSVIVGVRSNNQVVLAALKRSSGPLSSYHEKIFEVDKRCGITMAGLAADGRVLCRFLRREAMNHQYIYNSDIPIERMVGRVASSTLFPSSASFLHRIAKADPD